MRRSTDLAELSAKTNRGDAVSPDALFEAVYGELRRLARRYLRDERSDHTLQATALIHEAWLKLFDGAQRAFTDQVHFLAVASRVMRQVLVDYARSRRYAKRGGGA